MSLLSQIQILHQSKLLQRSRKNFNTRMHEFEDIIILIKFGSILDVEIIIFLNVLLK